MEENPHYVTPEQAWEKQCVIDPHNLWCTSKNCMAWRWKEIAEWKEGSDFVVTHSTTHGYCGMVRS